MASFVEPLTLQQAGEVPTPKLTPLQRIREAYKHVYEIVDYSGSPEISASATAKAAFAATEGHGHPRVVELIKTDEGLGFNVVEGMGQNSPIYISRIIPGGVADRHGGLKVFDQLLSVNGVSVEGENHGRAVELLKAASGSVKLVVIFASATLEDMELRFGESIRYNYMVPSLHPSPYNKNVFVLKKL